MDGSMVRRMLSWVLTLSWTAVLMGQHVVVTRLMPGHVMDASSNHRPRPLGAAYRTTAPRSSSPAPHDP